MATARAELNHTQDLITNNQIGLCEWETAGGPCHNPQPLHMLRQIVFYDGRPKLICPNHYKIWEKEKGLYLKHIRVQ